jgi:hypothetical protein
VNVSEPVTSSAAATPPVVEPDCVPASAVLPGTAGVPGVPLVPEASWLKVSSKLSLPLIASLVVALEFSSTDSV